ncbi:HHIP-like protein 1 isoform X2 [Antedon mediterranea]|uniref:HHIP-like protein 1 isoform X2 n=1 Tax=Antedon mediterranea TaxID=105859 RepID=UPI003AF7A08F
MRLFLMISILILKVWQVYSHPQCLDFYPPFENEQDLTFCSIYNEISCCTEKRDEELQNEFTEITRGMNEGDTCFDYIRDVLCQECSPYAAHLYDAETTGEARTFPGLCGNYCTSLHNTCSKIIPLLTEDAELRRLAQNGTSVEFCHAVEIPDMDYCYPDILDDGSLNKELDRALGGEGDGCLCLEEFANGLRNPLLAVHANDSTHRLYIAEQLGLVYIYLRNGSRIDEPFLDLQSAVLTSTRRGDERGFLGLAFHPDYKNNNRLFVYYTTSHENTLKVRLSEFSTEVENNNKVDATSEKILLQIVEPAANHNGGQLLFGMDGYLYISIGDGGKGGDPFGENGNAQNRNTLLGKILRIDVDNKDEGTLYAIPPTNPYADQTVHESRQEIYAYGVRNIWRCGMDRGDRETGYGRGRIICGDVGQSRFEEIDIIVNGGNYAWRAKEGFECYNEEMCNDPQWLVNEVLPIHAYPHSVGKSVTGGHIYRGCLFPKLNGLYIYGDYTNGKLFKLEENNTDNTWNNTRICMGDSSICTTNLLNVYPKNILSFGEDESGEIYMLATDDAVTSNTGGKVYRFVDPSLRRNPSECPLNLEEFDIIGTITPFTPTDPTSGSVFPRSSALCLITVAILQLIQVFNWSHNN